MQRKEASQRMVQSWSPQLPVLKYPSSQWFLVQVQGLETMECGKPNSKLGCQGIS